MNITAGPGVAVREFPLKTGFADYLLYAGCKAIGIAEAKPEGHTLTGVEIQSSKYTLGLPDGIPIYRKPLPFAYESTGAVTQFTNSLEPDFRSREAFTFHRPEELIRLAGLEAQLRANLRAMPDLNTERLWRVQIESTRSRKSKNSSPTSMPVSPRSSARSKAGWFDFRCAHGNVIPAYAGIQGENCSAHSGFRIARLRGLSGMTANGARVSAFSLFVGIDYSGAETPTSRRKE